MKKAQYDDSQHKRNTQFNDLLHNNKNTPLSVNNTQHNDTSPI